MARRPRDIGTAAESAVCRYLAANGFPHAERRSLKGTFDQGDVTGTPGICWEVKGGAAAKTASDGLIATWLDETDLERVNARADIGVLVVQRAGIGPANAGRWWAVVNSTDFIATDVPLKFPVRLYLADAVTLLRVVGYGTPLDLDTSTET